MKFYFIIASVVILLIAISGTAYFAFDYGKESERARTAAQIEEYRDNQKLLIDKLAKAQANEGIIVKTKIKTIRQVIDDCAASSIHPDILKQLRN